MENIKPDDMLHLVSSYRDILFKEKKENSLLHTNYPLNIYNTFLLLEQQLSLTVEVRHYLPVYIEVLPFF